MNENANKCKLQGLFENDFTDRPMAAIEERAIQGCKNKQRKMIIERR